MGLKLFRESPQKAFLQELRGSKKKVKSMPVWLFTIYYLIGVGAIILGVKTGPFQNTREPILPSELPENIPIFIVMYFLILGALKLSDYLRDRRK